jgi:hypothetical protein
MVIEVSHSNINFEMQKPEAQKLNFIQLRKWVRASKEIIRHVDLSNQTLVTIIVGLVEIFPRICGTPPINIYFRVILDF